MDQQHFIQLISKSKAKKDNSISTQRAWSNGSQEKKVTLGRNLKREGDSGGRPTCCDLMVTLVIEAESEFETL